jgi:hypothetical protein
VSTKGRVTRERTIFRLPRNRLSPVSGLKAMRIKERATANRLVEYAALFLAAAIWSCATPPPKAPSAPTGNSNVLTGASHSYNTSVTDPDAGPVSLRFTWDDGDTSGWTAKTYSLGDTAVVSHSWSLSGIFHVRAQTRDAKARTSPFSDSLAVTVTAAGDEPPDTPNAPLGPDSGVVNVSYTLRTSTTDVDNDSLSFRFDWGAGDTSDWLGPVLAGETLSVSHSWSAPGTYGIHVQAKDIDGFGVTSGWSPPHTTVIR